MEHSTHDIERSGRRDGIEDSVPVSSGTVGPPSTRRRLVGGAVAVALVGAVSAGVIVAATLSGAVGDAAPAASAAPTASATPTASSGDAPTPAAAPLPVVLGGDCSRVLSDAEATEILGTATARVQPLRVTDPGVIGGVSCWWGPADRSEVGLAVAAYPIGVVPSSVTEQDGKAADCSIGVDCSASARAGDVWVVASGPSSQQVATAIEIVGGRAASEPGVPSEIPAGSWAAPACDRLRAVMAAQLDREDLVDYAGDSHPTGPEWEVQQESGAAAWCAALGEGDGSLAELIEVHIAPGTSGVSPGLVAAYGMRAVEVPTAESAWITPAHDSASRSTAIAASTGENTVLVTARFIDREALGGLVGALIESMQTTAG